MRGSNIADRGLVQASIYFFSPFGSLSLSHHKGLSTRQTRLFPIGKTTSSRGSKSAAQPASLHDLVFNESIISTVVWRSAWIAIPLSLAGLHFSSSSKKSFFQSVKVLFVEWNLWNVSRVSISLSQIVPRPVSREIQRGPSTPVRISAARAGGSAGGRRCDSTQPHFLYT